jgi:hypothetical protein
LPSFMSAGKRVDVIQSNMIIVHSTSVAAGASIEWFIKSNLPVCTGEAAAIGCSMQPLSFLP